MRKVVNWYICSRKTSKSLNMKKLSNILFYMLLSLLAMVFCVEANAKSAVDTTVFQLLNLRYAGLEKVRQQYERGNMNGAAEALLAYYRQRTGIVNPMLRLQRLTVSKHERQWADDALEHTFYVHDGYQPSFNYGKDIDWTYWPVKDNELRWQLHRHKWFTPMGKVYQLTKDERYAREWMAQYIDWIVKNPLVKVKRSQYERKGEETDKAIENAVFAWRPLETSHRVQDQINQFSLFISSPSFNASFLTSFLVNYHRNANHIMENFSKKGNHLLFEAQRMFYAGTFFPEFKDAKTWQQRGISILNEEICKQVYADGGQFELDPHYHLASINIFCKTIEMAKANHVEQLIPPTYMQTVEKMVMFYANICFPDYTNPCFSDAKEGKSESEIRNYQEWSKLFPENEAIRYLATQGKQGRRPPYLSKGFPVSGFFTFRNGWDMNATVMVVKAGPKGEWHCQPDNGTFELWFHGRKLFPDSGSYVYAGDDEVQKQRDWFRQTTVHNTLTLNHQNMETTQSETVLWQPEGATPTLVTQNPSYRDLQHRRTVFFVDNQFFVIVDEATGTATGTINLNYHLRDGQLAVDSARLKVSTLYDGKSNLVLQCFTNSHARLKVTEGFYSLAYRQKTPRPSLSFDVEKNNSKPVSFVTVITPLENSSTCPVYKARLLKSTDGEQEVELIVNGKKRILKWNK